MTDLSPSFLKLVSTATPDLLVKMQNKISEQLSITKNLLTAPSNCFNNVKDFVVFKESLPELNEDFQNQLLEEAESLHLNTNTKGLHTQWLNSNPGGYTYGGKGHASKDISEFPSVSMLMNVINSLSESTGDMNSCLVSCYSSAETSLSYHADDEEDQISQSSSICSYSVGSTRTFEVVKKKAKITRLSSSEKPLLSLELINGSLTIMRPGCQQHFLHRVRRSSKSQSSHSSPLRYSFSFRHYASPLDSSLAPSTPLRTPDTSSPRTPDTSSSNLSSVEFSPVPPPPKVKPIILLAGDSFLKALDPLKLGKGKITVVNIASGGSKIKQVEDSIKRFASKDDSPPVRKIFISIGANDIRYVKNGVQHLKTPLTNLLKSTKSLYPNASIFIQSMLPIPRQRPNMITDVLDMNNLIFNICCRMRVYYLDIIEKFLDHSSGLRSPVYFPDAKDVHPGKIGNSVLARIYLRHIHSRRFNPLGY